MVYPDGERLDSQQLCFQYAFCTTGLDLNLEVALWERPGFSYTTGLQGTTYRSVYEETGTEGPTLLITPGNIYGTPVVVLQEGGQMGELAGPEFTGTVDAEGAPVFEDLNGDGVINRQPSLFGQPESDLTTLGPSGPALKGVTPIIAPPASRPATGTAR